MEKSNIIAKIYGYLICLVTVITFLIALTSLVNAIIDKGDPIHFEMYGSNTQNLASYDIYKMEALKSMKNETNAEKTSFLTDEKTMHAMYEAAKQEKIHSAMHLINKEIFVNTLLIIICVLLFFTHWRWVRRLAIKA